MACNSWAINITFCESRGFEELADYTRAVSNRIRIVRDVETSNVTAVIAVGQAEPILGRPKPGLNARRLLRDKSWDM